MPNLRTSMSKVYSNKALPPGTVLREWRLEQVLGVGGFGIVYKGRGIYFDELVAIKEYFPSAISDRKDGDTVVPNDSSAEEVHALGLKKFVEEAKLLWNLSTPTRHPNIVSVRSLFEIHGTAYMGHSKQRGNFEQRDHETADEDGHGVKPSTHGPDRTCLERGEAEEPQEFTSSRKFDAVAFRIRSHDALMPSDEEKKPRASCDQRPTETPQRTICRWRIRLAVAHLAQADTVARCLQ